MPAKAGVQSEIMKRLSKVKFAERVRNEADDKYGYSKHLKMYSGDFKSMSPSWMQGIDMIPINEVYAYAKTFIPSVYSRDPYIVINPKGRRYVVGAKILELAVNAYWRDLKLKRQIRRAVFDAIFAEGYIKVGYTASLGDASKPQDGKMLFPSEYIKDESIFAERVSYKNIVRDPDAVDGLHDARWYAHRIILPLQAVKDSSLFEHVDLKPNYTAEISGPPTQRGDHEFTTEEDYLVFWEEWNRDEEMVYAYAEGCDKYLMKKKWPYNFDGFNLELLRFNDCHDEPYAPNLIGPWEPQLWEKIKIRAMELDHIKRFGRQMICEKGALTPQEEDKFKKGISGSVIKHEHGKAPPVPIPYPQIQTDMYAIENRIDMDKDNISGQPNVVRSAPQKTQSRTLGELDRLMGSFVSRQNDPQSIVEEFSEAVAAKIIGLMRQYFKKDKYIRASGLSAQWLQAQMQDNPEADRFDESGFIMKRSDIQDIDFEVDIRAGSTLPLDKKGRVQAMTSIIELKEHVGIMPGSKTARVIGKNLIAEFDMPEIDAAYEEDIRRMEAARAANEMAALAQNQLLDAQMAREQARVRAKQSQIPASGGQPAGGGGFNGV